LAVGALQRRRVGGHGDGGLRGCFLARELVEKKEGARRRVVAAGREARVCRSTRIGDLRRGKVGVVVEK
jgi:hypothetical protein